MDINSFQMKRVNPFQGLVVDADTWKDAHNYHRQNMKLHIFAFHKTGIVSGFDVTASNPPDVSVSIGPGIAIDSDGNSIIMPQKQRYHLQTHEKHMVYLVIQFREIPGEPFQPPEGGQPTRILEAYRVQERDALPSEAYVELARIDYDPAIEGIKNARNQGQPAINEINLNFREEAAKTLAERIPVVTRESVPSATREFTPATEALSIGFLPLGGVNKDLHKRGLLNLAREVTRRSGLAVAIEDDINLKKPLGRFSLIYLTGNGRIELNPEQQTALNSYLQSGGIIFGDGCSVTSGGIDSKGAREFGLAINRLASQFNYKLGIVQRGHQLLSADHIFSEVPAGCEPPMLLEGGSMVCSSSDYGCAWDGGHADQPLSRDIIRSALEIGVNIVAYAMKTRGTKR
jgi:hypothetical protein